MNIKRIKTKNLFSLLLIIAVLMAFCFLPVQVRADSQPPQVSLYFTQSGSIAPLTSFAVKPGDSVTLDIHLNSVATSIDGYDFTIKSPNDLSIQSPITEGDGAQRFDTALVGNANVSGQTNSVRLARITTNTQTGGTIQGDLKLATITFKAANIPGSAQENIVFEGPNNKNPAIVSPSDTKEFVKTVSSPTSYGIGLTTKVSFSLNLPNASNKLKNFTVCLYTTDSQNYIDTKGEFPSCSHALSQNTQSLEGVNGTYTATAFDMGMLVDKYKNTLGPGSTGTYIAVIRPEQYTIAETQPVTLTATADGTVNNLTPTGTTLVKSPILGDINGDNSIDALDWNILNDCGYLSVSPKAMNIDPVFTGETCQAHNTSPTTTAADADLDSDGVIDGIDFNIWDIGMQKFNGSSNTANNAAVAPSPTITITPTAGQ